MLRPHDAGLLDRILTRITANSDPIRDIHYLTVAACIPAGRSSEQSRKIANALVNLEPKIVTRGLNQDRDWDDRIGEIYRLLVSLDGNLPAAIISQKDFGRPGHVLFLTDIDPKLRAEAIEAFIKKAAHDPQFRWTNGIVFLVGESPTAEQRALLRSKYNDFSLRGAVVMTLTQQPEEVDRARFLEGLESSRLEVIKACLAALEELPASGRCGRLFRVGRSAASPGK